MPIDRLPTTIKGLFEALREVESLDPETWMERTFLAVVRANILVRIGQMKGLLPHVD
jgi:hypothetical protein